MCAAVAVCSAGLHAALLGHAANAAAGALMAVMIAACLYCARDLWLRGTPRAWCVVALMNLAMIALHLPAPVHHHAAGATAAGTQSSLMAVATVVASVEVGVAGAVLCYRARGHARLVSGRPAR
jgi:hypothetical protein